MTTSRDDPAKEFHAHLDVCQQCERHPFDLCPVGAKLIQKAMDNLQADIREHRVHD